MFCPDDLKQEMKVLGRSGVTSQANNEEEGNTREEEGEEQEDEEEEQEDEEEKQEEEEEEG